MKLIPILLLNLLISSICNAADIDKGGTDWQQVAPVSYPQERKWVSSSDYPWRTIGRVNLAGRGHCSGVLVAKDTVITSAHCLWNRSTDRWFPAQYVTFVAGAEKESYQDYANAVSYEIADGFSPRTLTNPEALEHDWALIKLAKPIGKSLGFLPLAAQVSPGQNIIQTGYRADREFVLTVERNCRVDKTYDNGKIIQTSCHTISGDSGGPVLIRNKDKWSLVGIHRGRTNANKSLVVTSKNFRRFIIGE
ncbi:trypsin-like serine peptidase [Amphritea sp. HPY]|uniref:trypsin-like serine peptidase n=1 Tax=Amphritea sp. HPY TaxID=3421652 RepID=UPI003D7C4D7B